MVNTEKLIDTARVWSYRTIPTRIRDQRLLHSLQAASLGLEGTHKYLSELVRSNRPALVARPGGIESDVVEFFLSKRFASRKSTPPKYPHHLTRKASVNAGIAHGSDSDIDAFAIEYLYNVFDADVMGFGLYARAALPWAQLHRQQGRLLTYLHDLEPFRAVSHSVVPWTKALEGLRVLVVHPFGESIDAQYGRWQSVTGVSDMLAPFTLSVMRPPVTFAGEGDGQTWAESLSKAKTDMETYEFDVAIVGAGSYGLPLAAHAKSLGKVGIHLGGVTQLLFGISGRRWDGVPPISTWADSSWVRPRPSEIPQSANKVEKGAYW